MLCGYATPGTALASAGLDRVVKIWDVKGFRELKSLTIKGSKEGIVAAVFLRDGKVVRQLARPELAEVEEALEALVQQGE